MSEDFYVDEEEARLTEQFYQSPEMVAQRMATLDVLGPAVGEHILDVGCGPGLLVHDLALAVGESGRVTGVDDSTAMIDLARARCAGLTQVSLQEGPAQRLPLPDSRFDAAACIQVLLYVPEVEAALAEMHRALKPGGRVVVMETDWRGVVVSTSDKPLTERIIATWDAVVPSPNLPSRLGALLRGAGFTAVRPRAVPIINTSYTPGHFAHGMLQQFADFALERGVIDAGQEAAWLADLERLEGQGAFFFCVNRFLFSGVKI